MNRTFSLSWWAVGREQFSFGQAVTKGCCAWLLILGVFLSQSGFQSASAAQQRPSSTQGVPSGYAKLATKVNQLYKNRDERFITELHNLKSFSVSFIVDFAMELFHQELEQPFPDVNFLEAIIAVFADKAWADHVPELSKYRVQMERVLLHTWNTSTDDESSQMDIKYISDTMEDAIQRASKRAEFPTLILGDDVAQAMVARPKKVWPDIEREVRIAGIGNIRGFMELMNDVAVDQYERDGLEPILFRDDDASRLLDVMVRTHDQVVTVLGESKVGKSAVIERLVQKVVTGEMPGGQFSFQMGRSIWFKVNVPILAHLNGGMEAVIMAAKGIQEIMRRRVVLVFPNAHEISRPDVELLAKEMHDEKIPLSFVFESTQKEIEKSFLAKRPEYIASNQVLRIRELSSTQVESVVNEKWREGIARHYNVTISDAAVKAAVEVSRDYRSDISRPASTQQLLMDAAVATHRANNGQAAVLDPSAVYRLIADRMQLPVAPQDRAAFIDYIETLRARIKERVIAQDPLVDGLVDAFASAMEGKTRKHSVAMVMGTTGVGKSFAADVLAKLFYGSRERVLELDMTKFQSLDQAKNALFGAAPGYVSSTDTQGLIGDFVSGPGAGGGIYILNEIDKANPEVLKQFMEVFDRGSVLTGRGNIYPLGHSLIVMTTNRGATELLRMDDLKSMTPEQIKIMVENITPDRMKQAFTTSSFADKEKALPPELPERVDTWIFASPLAYSSVLEIANIQVQELVQEFKDNGYGKLSVSSELTEAIAKAIYNPEKGARAVNKALSRYIKVSARRYLKLHPTALDIQLSAAHDDKDPAKIKIEVSEPNGAGEKLVLDGPRIPVENVLRDAVMRDRIVNLEANLKKDVMGQDDAIKELVNQVIGKAMRPGDKIPASIFLLGMTGTGKTELMKSLARHYYADEGALEIFQMSQVKTTNDLVNIFNPSKNEKGGDDVGAFERFLQNHPEGGVIGWDEMSNIGGGVRSQKEAIAKEFYGIFDEGKWTSTVTGKKYDLSKFTMILTGNDGQEEFVGITSDDLLEQHWSDLVKKNAQIRGILTRDGFPEAFLGRIKAVVLMRPLMSTAKPFIAKKLRERYMKTLPQNEYDIEFSPDFDELAGQLMFSSKEGARSIRNFIDTEVAAAVALAAEKFDWENASLHHRKIFVSIKAHGPKNPFFWVKKEKITATVSVELSENGKMIHAADVDFSQKAFYTQQIRRFDATGTAFHEAGHLVVNKPEITGKKTSFVTIVPGSYIDKNGDLAQYLGLASFEKLEGILTDIDRDKLVLILSGYLAGGIAEKMIGRPRNTGVGGEGGSDLGQTRSLLTQLGLRGGLIPELDGMTLSKDGSPDLTVEQRKVLNRWVAEIIKDANALAEKTMIDNWALMGAVAMDLMKSGTITGKRFDELKKEVKNKVRAKELLNAQREFIEETNRRQAKCERWLGVEKINQITLPPMVMEQKASFSLLNSFLSRVRALLGKS